MRKRIAEMCAARARYGETSSQFVDAVGAVRHGINRRIDNAADVLLTATDPTSVDFDLDDYLAFVKEVCRLRCNKACVVPQRFKRYWEVVNIVFNVAGAFAREKGIPCAVCPTPTSGEIASSLELRRNILTAGVSYLDAQPKRTQSRFPESSGGPER